MGSRGTQQPPPRPVLLSDSLRGGLRQFQLWQAPDTGQKDYTHVGDLNPTVFDQVPLAVLESKSWVIFIRENTLSTPMMRKSDFAWFELKADYQLPFGDKNGLYGWMFEGDTLMVVNEGKVTGTIDLTAHVAKHKSEQPQFVEARSELVLPHQTRLHQRSPCRQHPLGMAHCRLGFRTGVCHTGPQKKTQ